MKDWYFILADIAQWSILIPVFWGLFRFPVLSGPQKKLFSLLLFSLGMQMLGDILKEIYNNNAPGFHAYILGEFTFILLIFRKELSRLFPAFLGPVLLLGFALLSILDATLLSGFTRMPNYARTTEGILAILLAISYFALLYREREVLFLEKQFLFWFSSGLILFFSFNLLLYFFSNYLVENFLNAAGFLFVFHSVMVLVLYVFYFAGLSVDETSNSLAPPKKKGRSVERPPLDNTIS